MVINPQKDHAVTSLAEIFSLKEINEITGLEITFDEYCTIGEHYKMKNRKQTKKAFKKLAQSSYKGLVDAKKDYCLTKYKHGVLDAASTTPSYGVLDATG